jgi:hypothetical protein
LVGQLPTWEHFEQVGHSLFGLLVALASGLLGAPGRLTLCPPFWGPAQVGPDMITGVVTRVFLFLMAATIDWLRTPPVARGPFLGGGRGVYEGFQSVAGPALAQAAHGAGHWHVSP